MRTALISRIGHAATPLVIVAAFFLSVLFTNTRSEAEGLSSLRSWNDTPTRARIIDFVSRVTTPGGPEFVAPEDRIATFGMDGTVITEKPANVQKFIDMAWVCVIGTNEPNRAAQSPFKQACAKDHGYFPGIAGAQVLRDHAAGRTQAAYRKYAEKALELGRHPILNRSLGALVYAPMLELARYLQQNGFQVFVVSGATQPLVRELVELRFHLSARHGIGMAWPVEFYANPDGIPVFRWKTGGKRLPSVHGAGKPLAILRHIGRPPIFAAGNTSGDLEMLQYATKRNGPGMGIVIVHDDAEREYAYSAPKIEAAARANAWTLVSMKNDFKVVFVD
jgi:hypothetical protein